jgi:hypothetical protein
MTGWTVRDHAAVGEPEDTIDQLVARYRATLVEMDSQKVESGGKPRTWNRLVDRMQAVHLELRATQRGRDAITKMISDENPTVRSWSAVNALAWAPAEARAELEREAAAGGVLGFGAEISLREFDAGRLNTAWEPRRRKDTGQPRRGMSGQR